MKKKKNSKLQNCKKKLDPSFFPPVVIHIESATCDVLFSLTRALLLRCIEIGKIEERKEERK